MYAVTLKTLPRCTRFFFTFAGVSHPELPGIVCVPLFKRALVSVDWVSLSDASASPTYTIRGVVRLKRARTPSSVYDDIACIEKPTYFAPCASEVNPMDDASPGDWRAYSIRVDGDQVYKMIPLPPGGFQSLPTAKEITERLSQKRKHEEIKNVH